MNKYKVLLTIILLIPVSLMGGNFDFAEIVTLDVNNYPFKVIAEDVNNDGYADIITAGEEFISIHINQTNGTFIRYDYAYQGSGQIGLDMCALDIDNDNDIDLAFSNETSEYWAYLTILTNNGDGTFAQYVMADAYPGMTPTDIDAADFNNDGFTDLVTANSFGWSLTVYFNNQSGNFTDFETLPSGGQVYCVTSADLDQDNDIDLAAATLGWNNLFIFNNNGDGTFADTIRYPSFFSSYSIHAADLNNDSYPDLITSVEDGEYIGYVTVYLNNGLGEFNSNDAYYNRSGKADEVIAVNLDNDNYLDMAVVGYDNNLVLFQNDGTGTFSWDTSYAVGQAVSSVASADFDNDGKNDLVTANRNDHTISVLFSSEIISCCQQRGDVNHDGTIGISDLTFLVDYMFQQGAEPICYEEGDVNNSGQIDISDVTYYVQFLFSGGAPPPPCL